MQLSGYKEENWKKNVGLDLCCFWNHTIFVLKDIKSRSNLYSKYIKGEWNNLITTLHYYRDTIYVIVTWDKIVVYINIKVEIKQ